VGAVEKDGRSFVEIELLQQRPTGVRQHIFWFSNPCDLEREAREPLDSF
jgi:hypothetical protein